MTIVVAMAIALNAVMLGHSLVVDFCHITLAACLTVSPGESSAQVTKMKILVMKDWSSIFCRPY